MAEPMLLNRGWRFYLGDEPNADFMGFDDSSWREVNLPHDWSVEHPFDRHHASGTGYLPGGTAWYRKHFILPEDTALKRVRITFNGVYKHARVWINSNYLGTRAYGYATFTYDISAFVRPGENVICVRVQHNEVADSRWFTGSGIYRDVQLEISDPVSFETDGIFVTTPVAGKDEATVAVNYETTGASCVRMTVISPEGEELVTGCSQGSFGLVEVAVRNPRRWCPEDPALYTLKAQAFSGDQVRDEKLIRFGIRSIFFDCNKGFFLNGVSTKLKGLCIHHDGGALGAAVPREVWERRLRRFMETGCNAIRTAHNPPDPLLLDLCDELGLMVMDEAFDEWEGIKNKWWQGHNVYPPKRFGYGEDFPQWHEADLTGMVKRDRNHPCIVLWSIGNEIDYPNDPYVTPLFKEVLGNNDANKPQAQRMYDVRKPDAGRLAVLARELTELVHTVDTSRPVTSAMSFPQLSTRTGYADALDASGYNYKEQFYEEDHRRFPDRVIYGSENSHDPKAWFYVRDNEYICGQFLWTGIDFLGECRGWPVRISQAGMLNLAGFPKALFYQRKALWSDEPFVQLASGSEKYWEQNPTAWVGAPGELKTVMAFTNQSEAELFLNGRSLGVQTVNGECRALWQVAFEPGELTVKAGSCTSQLKTPGQGRKLTLVPVTNVAQSDVRQYEVYLTDASGVPAVGKDERIHVQVLGDVEILGIENGRPDDLTPYAEKWRETYDGKALIILRLGNKLNTASLHVWTDSGLMCHVDLK